MKKEIKHKSNNQFILEQMKKDKEFSDILIKTTIEEYEKDKLINTLISTFEDYIKVYGLKEFSDVLQKSLCLL